jgi:high-affinity iron transporter
VILEAVVIILREVLEAALLISLLLVVSHVLDLGIKWLIPATSVGLLGAILYARNIAWVSEQMDYAGQELLNASLQILIWSAIAVLFLISGQVPVKKRAIQALMATIVAFALIRECSEILLYVFAFGTAAGQWTSILASGAIGAVTGICVGLLIYLLILWTSVRHNMLTAAYTLLSAVTAGIVTQAVSLLEQVDHIPSASPIWDTSRLIPENSVIGQLLYALLGYEATPSIWHVSAYLTVLISLFAAYRLPYKSAR